MGRKWLIGGLLLAACRGAAPVPDNNEEAPPPRTKAAPRAAADAPDLAGAATLARLLPAALQRNPAILAARARWGAAVEQITLARSLPDPMLTYGHFIDSVETRVGPQEQVINLQQRVPFPWKLKLAADSAGQAARAQGLAYEIVVRDVVVALKEAYFEYWYLNRSQAISRGHLELLERLLATARNEQARGLVTLTDLLRLESQKAQLEYDLLTLAELERVTRARINALVDRRWTDPLGAPGDLAAPRDLALDVPALVALGEEQRQEIRQARVELERARIELDRAWWAMAPDLTLGGQYVVLGPALMRSMPDSGQDVSLLTLGLTLPIWPDKNRARIRKARKLQEARRQMIAGEQRKLDRMVEQLAFRVRNARRLVELYGKTLLPQAEQAARLAREWYEGGQGGFMHLIEVQSVLYNYHLALDRARADYHQATNRLEGLVGASLHGRGR